MNMLRNERWLIPTAEHMRYWCG